SIMCDETGSCRESYVRRGGHKLCMFTDSFYKITGAPFHTWQVPSWGGRAPGTRPARLGLGLLDCFLRVDPPRSRAGFRSGSTRRRHLGTGAPLSLRRRTSRPEALDFDEDDIVGAVGVRDLVLGSGRACVADTGLEVGDRRAAVGIAHVHRIGDHRDDDILIVMAVHGDDAVGFDRPPRDPEDAVVELDLT